ncbi:MAG: cell wall-binding repeat-containing protein [Oscillospiraceae bacterium]|nr:cell wall-binding repeat-containing protein [Oscillospiraceae bacterium]
MFKRILAVILAMVMVVPILSTVAEAAITENEYGLIYFETFEDLKELAKGTYTLFKSKAVYQGKNPLVIEEDLVLPDYLGIIFADLIIPEGVTLTGRDPSTSITVEDNLTVDGTLEWDSQMHVYEKMEITGSVILDGSITLYSSESITGRENVHFEYNGVIRETCSVTTVDEIKEILERAYSSGQWEFEINYWSSENQRIEESLIFPENCVFNHFTPKGRPNGSGGILTIAENCSVIFNCPVHIGCGIDVEGTLEFNGKSKDPWGHEMFIDYNRGGKLSFTETGKFAGVGDIQISGSNMTGPEDALAGMDLSIFNISEEIFGVCYVLENVGGVASPVKLGMPTNLHWDEEHAGYIHFRAEYPTEYRYQLSVYRTDSDEPYYTTTAGSKYDQKTDYCIEYFVKNEEVADGSYYFTVKALGDGEHYLDSDIATSSVWEYKKPNNKISAPKILGWNGTNTCFSSTEDVEKLSGYWVYYYYAASITDTPRWVRGSRIDDPTATMRTLEDAYIAEMGAGYYYYAVQALSNNIAAACHSDLSEMSEAYYYNPGHTHSFGEWKTVQKATCEEAGMKQRNCSCGTTESEVIPATGHTEVVDAAVEETCVTEGKTAGSHCSVCKKVIEAQTVIPALGHNYVDGFCTRCGRDENAVQEIVRLSGETRYETSFTIANEMKEALGIEKLDTVILASSENFADALAGSYLAAQKQAPILIGKLKYADLVCDYVNNNLVTGGTVYVLGGEGAVPEAMLEGIAVTDNIVRLAGAERYDTNLAILEEAGIGRKDLLVATGRDFADSLSASATGLPILLVNGKAGKTLSAEQKAFLATVEGEIYIIGGDSAVPAALKAEIENASGKIATRIAGGSRYETSVQIAQKFFTSADKAVVAYASTFPDGLCGGPLAYVLDAPLLLTKNGKTEAPGYTAKNGIVSGYVLGGTGLISDEFAAQIFAY